MKALRLQSRVEVKKQNGCNVKRYKPSFTDVNSDDVIFAIAVCI